MPSKKEVLLSLLSRSAAFVQLDGRAPGVELPDWLRTDASVVLQLGYDLPVPILDLTIDDDCIRATLSFRRSPFQCRVPWAAIYAISDGDDERTVFADDLPPDLRSRAVPALRSAPPMPSPQAAAAPSASSPPPDPPSPKAKRPNHLKLVK